MAAPTNAANVKKALANSEPSTHGTNAKASDVRFVAALKVLAYAALTFAESTPLTPIAVNHVVPVMAKTAQWLP